jgi:hypothetical protein
VQSKLGSSHSVTPALHPLTTHIVLTAYNTCCYYQAVVLGKGGPRQDPSQKAGGLPTLTNSGDQTKIQRVLHVEGPTKCYQDLCSRSECHWQIRFGLPGLTTVPIWAGHHYNIVLPTLTSRGVKYTHDINGVILHHHSGPTRIRLISQASTQKEITVGDPPTPRHNVATPHAASTLSHGGWVPSNRPSSPQPHHKKRTAQLLQSKDTILVKNS